MGGAHRSSNPPVSVVCEPLLILKALVIYFHSLSQSGLAGQLVEMHLAIFNGQVKYLVKLEEAFCQFSAKIFLRVAIHLKAELYVGVDIQNIEGSAHYDLDEEAQGCHEFLFS